MCYEKITCPHCSSFNLKKNGKTPNKKQKYRCRECAKQFILDYQYQGCRQSVRSLIVPMTMNSSGIRYISRVLHISTNTAGESNSPKCRPHFRTQNSSSRKVSGVGRILVVCRKQEKSKMDVAWHHEFDAPDWSLHQRTENR